MNAQSKSMKTIIERGASWTLEETKLLLSLWGQDMITRQATGQKRTKEVYDKISLTFREQGYERTAEQVRTRVFNMIAEYRRILKDSNPERMKKCIFFEPLHKIYQAKHIDDVKSALDDYEPDNPYSPPSMPEREESISDSEAIDESLISSNKNASGDRGTDSINHNNDNSNAPAPSSQKTAAPEVTQPVKKPRLDSPKAGTSADPPADVTKHKNNPATPSVVPKQQQSLLLGGGGATSSGAKQTSNAAPTFINVSSTLKNGVPNGTATAARLSTNALTGHQFYPAPISTYDVTSTALLIDRVFSHLSRESENMREWIALEKDRIQLERFQRAQAAERESRRERILTDTFHKFQDQWISFVKEAMPGVIESHADRMPTLRFPKDPFTEPEPSGNKGKSLLADTFNDMGETDATASTNDYTRNSTPASTTASSTASRAAPSTAASSTSTTIPAAVSITKQEATTPTGTSTTGATYTELT